MASKTGHKGVRVKVNAWVDEGIAPLVLALNEFPNVVNLDSCEGTAEEGAYVYFRCCNDPFEPRARDTVELVFRIASALRSHPSPCSDYRLRLEWMASEEPMAEITTYRNNISTIAARISLLAADVTHQTIPSVRDKACITPRNLTTCQDHQHFEK